MEASRSGSFSNQLRAANRLPTAASRKAAPAVSHGYRSRRSATLRRSRGMAAAASIAAYSGPKMTGVAPAPNTVPAACRQHTARATPIVA